KKVAATAGSLFTSTARSVTQIKAGFGTPILTSSHQNNSLLDAQTTDFASWSTAPNPDFFDGQNPVATPHLTIKGSGTGGLDYYSFTVTSDMAGERRHSHTLSRAH